MTIYHQLFGILADPNLQFRIEKTSHSEAELDEDKHSLSNQQKIYKKKLSDETFDRGE
jgi:hypothetical protein